MTYLATLELASDKLRPWPGNPRQGNVTLIEQSVTRNTQYRSVVALADEPDHPEQGGQLMCGHHVWYAVRALGLPTIRAEFHQVDQQTAERIVAVDNESFAKGKGTDERLLLELLAGHDDLTGTGYDRDELDKMARDLDADMDAATKSVGEEPEPQQWHRVSLNLPDDVWKAWRSALDEHADDTRELGEDDRKGDVAKLAGLLRGHGYL